MRFIDDGFGPIIPARLSGCFFGANESSQKSQSQQGPVANPAFPALMANANRATGIAETPFEGYSGQLVAPSNAGLDTSFNLFNNISANGTGAPTLGAGIDATKSAAGFQPTNVTAGSLPGTDLSGYMNPFQKNVTDTTMADIERQRQIQRVNDNQSATGANAFGGARQGVADSLTNEASQRTAATTLAGLNFQNFNNAQGAATGDLNRALTAGTANQSAGIAGAGLRLNAGAQLGAMSDQELQQALARANAVNTSGTQQRTIEQQKLDAAYQEFMRRLNYPIQGQTLINQSLGLLGPGGVSNAGTSSGSQQSFGFNIAAPSGGKG